MLDSKTKDVVVSRLAKIEGQMRGLARMAEEPRPCVDIITQIAAAQAALKKVGDIILDHHLNGCLEEAVIDGNVEERRRRVDELREFLAQYRRLPMR